MSQSVAQAKALWRLREDFRDHQPMDSLQERHLGHSGKGAETVGCSEPGGA